MEENFIIKNKGTNPSPVVWCDASGKSDPAESIEKVVEVMAKKLGSCAADIF
jgi:hypothetical protein